MTLFFLFARPAHCLARADAQRVAQGLVLAGGDRDAAGGERPVHLLEGQGDVLVGRGGHFDEDGDVLLVLEVVDLDLEVVVLPFGRFLTGAQARGRAGGSDGRGLDEDALGLDVAGRADADVEGFVLGQFLDVGVGGELELVLRVTLQHLDGAGRQRGAEVVLRAVLELETHVDGRHAGGFAGTVVLLVSGDEVFVLDLDVGTAEERELTALAVADADLARDAIDLALADGLDGGAVSHRGFRSGIRGTAQTNTTLLLPDAAGEQPEVGVFEVGAGVVDDIDGRVEVLDELLVLVVDQRVLGVPAQPVGLVEEVEVVGASLGDVGFDHQRGRVGQAGRELADFDVTGGADHGTGGGADDGLAAAHEDQFAGDLTRVGARADGDGHLLADRLLEDLLGRQVGGLVVGGLVLEVAGPLGADDAEAVLPILAGDAVELDAILAGLQLDGTKFLDLAEAFAVDGDVDGAGGVGDGQLCGIIGHDRDIGLGDRGEGGDEEGSAEDKGGQPESVQKSVHARLYPVVQSYVRIRPGLRSDKHPFEVGVLTRSSKMQRLGVNPDI